MVPVIYDVPPKPPIRAVLKLTYACNQRCAFCRVDALRQTVEDVPAETVVRKALAAKALGVEMILFSGGEPTMRADLPRLAKAIGSIGMSWGLITNGRRLADKAFCEAMLGLGLAYVHTSLHGATAATHDGLVECAAFDEVLVALRQIQGRGVEVHVNTVVTRTNVGELIAIGELLAGITPITHKISLAEPKGRFLERTEALWVAPEVAGRAAEEAVADCRLHHEAAGLVVVVEGFPPCQVPSAQNAMSGLRDHNIRYMSEGFEDDMFATDDGARTYLQPCQELSLIHI